MLTNAKQYIFIIAVSLLIGAVTTYSWNNQTLSEMVEEHNQQILSDCLTKARIQKTAKEILEYASHCDKSILTTISAPRSMETITWTGEIICPELYYSWMTIESPRMWVTFYFTKEEVKELYPNCKIWTHSTGNTVPPLWFQLIPQASAKSVESVSKELQIKNTKVSTTHSTIWDTNTWNVRTPKQIYEQVKHLGYREAPAISLISTCKASSWDPRHCILVWLVLMYNEAGNQQKSKACIDRNNCFGIKSWKAVYSSLDEWMENWVIRFNKYWYKADSAEYFYPDLWKTSTTKYCTTEKQHEPKIGCPDWQEIATAKWNQLYPLIYK